MEGKLVLVFVRDGIFPRIIIGLYRENAIAIESEASDSLTYSSNRICVKGSN